MCPLAGAARRGVTISQPSAQSDRVLLASQGDPVSMSGAMSSDVLRTEPLPARRTRWRYLRWRGEAVDWSGYAFMIPFVLPFRPVHGRAAAVRAVRGADGVEHCAATRVGRAARTSNGPSTTRWRGRRSPTRLRYCLIIVPSVTVLGFIFATFVNQRWPGYVVARIAFFSPFITSATVIGLVWVWLLDTRYGIINQYFGLQIPWLTSTSWSLIGVSLASIWWDLGLAFVLFLAGLQDIDPEVREASTVDGASRLQTTWYVVLPLLRPTLSLVITLQTITTLRIFSQIDLMTQGGPSTSSMSVITYVYQYGIKKYDFGYAAAVALILFAVIMVITIVHRRIVREQA